MKDVGIRIRVQRELRDRFLEACRSQDRPASQVLREFMRAYVVKLESSKEDKDRSSSAESTPA
ncbi:MAG: plasmid-related protein [Hyphomicrobiales bacterium]